MNDFVCVVGGINMDLTATSYEAIKMEDSNPGNVILRPGGVGRNIAENLCRLGVNTSLIAAIGDDVYSDSIIKNCNEVGIDISKSLYLKNENCGLYVCVNDNNGELCVAVSAMDICTKLTPNVLQNNIDYMNSAKLIMLDANLLESSIEFIAKSANIPVFADVVSIKKSYKFRNILEHISLLKTNRYEAEAMSGIAINNKASLEKATNIILAKGAKNLVITLGSEGAYYANGNQAGFVVPMRVNAINTTGCGDSFMAAMTACYLKNPNIYEMARYGVVAAGLTATHAGPVLPYLSMEMLERHLINIK